MGSFNRYTLRRFERVCMAIPLDYTLPANISARSQAILTARQTSNEILTIRYHNGIFYPAPFQIISVNRSHQGRLNSGNSNPSSNISTLFKGEIDIRGRMRNLDLNRLSLEKTGFPAVPLPRRLLAENEIKFFFICMQLIRSGSKSIQYIGSILPHSGFVNPPPLKIIGRNAAHLRYGLSFVISDFSCYGSAFSEFDFHILSAVGFYLDCFGFIEAIGVFIPAIETVFSTPIINIQLVGSRPYTVAQKAALFI